MLSIFGNISAPPGAAAYGGDFATGLLPFLNNIIRLIFVIAGLFAFFNLIFGGLGFISAGGDPKAIEKAWGKIYQSLIGLIIIVSSFVLSAIFGYILFGSATAILNPKIYGPDITIGSTTISPSVLVPGSPCRRCLFQALPQCHLSLSPVCPEPSQSITRTDQSCLDCLTRNQAVVNSICSSVCQ